VGFVQWRSGARVWSVVGFLLQAQVEGGCCAVGGCLWSGRTDVSCSVYNHVEELALE
jgi:hypothetical protein